MDHYQKKSNSPPLELNDFQFVLVIVITLFAMLCTIGCLCPLKVWRTIDKLSK